MRAVDDDGDGLKRKGGGKSECEFDGVEQAEDGEDAGVDGFRGIIGFSVMVNVELEKIYPCRRVGASTEVDLQVGIIVKVLQFYNDLADGVQRQDIIDATGCGSRRCLRL